MSEHRYCQCCGYDQIEMRHTDDNVVVTSLDDIHTARDSALEEAARVCNSVGAEYEAENGEADGAVLGALACAAAIRALKGEQHGV